MLALKKNVVGVCKKNIKVYCQAGEIAGECGLHPRAPACASSVGPVYVRNMSTCRVKARVATVWITSICGFTSGTSASTGTAKKKLSKQFSLDSKGKTRSQEWPRMAKKYESWDHATTMLMQHHDSSCMASLLQGSEMFWGSSTLLTVETVPKQKASAVRTSTSHDPLSQSWVCQWPTWVIYWTKVKTCKNH